MPAPRPHPHSPTDLVLAPVLIGIERNLERLRRSEDLEYSFALELNDDRRWYHGTQDRAERVREIAVRNVGLYGWDVQPSPDLYGLVVTRGEFQVTLMLGKRLAAYVEWDRPALGRVSA